MKHYIFGYADAFSVSFYKLALFYIQMCVYVCACVCVCSFFMGVGVHAMLAAMYIWRRQDKEEF